ncbi:MAG: hypothetical protein NPIRA01_09690 [Nitrospirales bacterium]|nr:MAG: hypothetical protein NPIRA01_09690 [Nitrospirales bacterium]
MDQQNPQQTNDSERCSISRRTTALLSYPPEEPSKKRTSSKNNNEIHVQEDLPDPYPDYPILISRTIMIEEARVIDSKYHVSDLPATGFDSEGNPLNYNTLAFRVFEDGEDCLDPNEDAFLQFGNILYYFCYEQDTLGKDPNLTWRIRYPRGINVRNEVEKVEPMKALDKKKIDEILERALRQHDFESIRAILNYEGYGIPVSEPNDMEIPEPPNDMDIEDVEIEMSEEEYNEWKAPMKDFSFEPEAVSQGRQEFTKAMAKNVPVHLERAIRQRDLDTLRMLLKLYGHYLSSNQPPDRDRSLGSNLAPKLIF